MNELLKYRKNIDEIDSDIAKLFEKRMEVVKNVSAYKLKNNLKTLDPKREGIMIENNCKKIKNCDLTKYYKEILQVFLKVSKDYQDDLK